MTALLLILVCFLLLAVPSTEPASPDSNPLAGMQGESFPIWPDSSMPEGEVVEETAAPGERPRRALSGQILPTLVMLRPEHPDPAGTAVVICPGGGYALLMIDHEGYELARQFNDIGVTAFVLKSRLPDGRVLEGNADMPESIRDVQRALRYVRANAGKWNLDPDRLGIVGSSAGGHLAGAAATMFTAGDSQASDPVERVSSRPDFALLLYPVVTMEGPAAHVGSRNNLLGEGATEAQRAAYSIDRRVTPRTPPIVVVHSADDGPVPIENAYLLRDAAAAHGVPFELYEYPTGGHGFGLGAGTEAAGWFDRYVHWLRERDLLQDR